MISLIVSTRNRARSLEACLDHAAALAPPDRGWEMVVVNNGSTDGTADVLDAVGRRFPGWRSLEEPWPGLTRSRNRGVAAAVGDILAFTDDDCYVARDFLRRIEAHFIDPSLGFLGGRIVLHDPADAPLGVTGIDEIRRLPPHQLVPPGLIQGSNFACRRPALEAVGGFDTGLGPGTPFNCEEIDCLSRISGAGWAGAFFPDVVVAHHHGRRPGCPQLAALLTSYAHGRGAYFAKAVLEGRCRPGEVGRLGGRWLANLATSGANPAVQELIGACHYAASRLARRAGRPDPI